MAVYKLGPVEPVIAATAFVAPSAVVVGDVALAENVGVWFGATVRGDNESIKIAANTNVQDLSVLHTDMGYPLLIGANVTIGHQATVHGCTIGDGTLVGIQAVVMNGAVVGRHCLIGAGALITEGKTFPERSLILGRPAKVVRALTDEELVGMARAVSDYVEKISRYKRALAQVA